MLLIDQCTHSTTPFFIKTRIAHCTLHVEFLLRHDALTLSLVLNGSLVRTAPDRQRVPRTGALGLARLRLDLLLRYAPLFVFLLLLFAFVGNRGRPPPPPPMAQSASARCRCSPTGGPAPVGGGVLVGSGGTP